MSWDAGVAATGLASIAVFALAFRFSGLIKRSRAAIATATKTLSVIRQSDLDDDEKERAAQKAAIELFRGFLLITLSACLVLAAPGIVIWAGDAIGLASAPAVLDFLLSWEVLIGASLLLVGLLWFLRRR